MPAYGQPVEGRTSQRAYVQKQQECVIAPALRARTVGNREHGIDLVFLEVRHGRCGGAPRRDGLDGRRVFDELRNLPRDEPEQRVQRRETQIARRGRVAALVFEVGEEATHDGRVDLFDRHPDGLGAMMSGSSEGLG